MYIYEYDIISFLLNKFKKEMIVPLSITETE